MSVIEAPTGAVSEPEPDVRDRADVRRQIRLVVTFAIALAVLVYFKLSIDNPDVTYVLGERITKEFKAKELDGIYDTIQKELRSQYLLAYQSPQQGKGDKFRAVEVKVARPGLEAKTIRGYFP